jgi:hypothetical protein
MLASPIERALAAPPKVDTEAEPFQQTVTRDSTADPVAVIQIGVPAGRVLVVEHVSARASVPIGQQVTGSVTCQGQDLGLADRSLIFKDHGAFGAVSAFAATQVMRCFASGAGGILFGIQRNSSTGLMTDIDVAISGHLRR